MQERRRKDFLKKTPEILPVNAKINKKDYVKLRRFCTAKEIANRLTMEITEWKNICELQSRVMINIQKLQRNSTEKQSSYEMGPEQALFKGKN